MTPMAKKNQQATLKRNSKDLPGAANLNIIADGSVIEGTFSTSSDTRLGGRIEGDIRVDGLLLITESGVVTGSVRADNANIAGAVNGEISVVKKALLASSANIKGHIYTDRLVIEEGASFNGECQMGHKGKPAQSDFLQTPVTDSERAKIGNEQLAEQHT